MKLVNVKETSKETTLCLAAAHALVKLDDGTIVGDPMERTTLEALNWQINKGISFLLSIQHSGPLRPRSQVIQSHQRMLMLLIGRSYVVAEGNKLLRDRLDFRSKVP